MVAKIQVVSATQKQETLNNLASLSIATSKSKLDLNRAIAATKRRTSTIFGFDSFLTQNEFLKLQKFLNQNAIQPLWGFGVLGFWGFGITCIVGGGTV